MMMLSNSLQWANKVGAQRKAAHPRRWADGIGRSASACAEQQNVYKLWTRPRYTQTLDPHAGSDTRGSHRGTLGPHTLSQRRDTCPFLRNFQDHLDA